MEKVFEIQRSARDNVNTLQTYLTDLQNWESEMKRKEAALNGVFEQDLPPVRSKIKKEKPVVVKKKPEKRIQSSDYQAWDKYDVDKACEEVENAEVGPSSLDGAHSQTKKMEKLREEAQYEKERGNKFVKQEKWDEAIKCYSRAIELVKDDAIYYANRGLCYLKKDSLHQAESDSTEAIRLDPTYVKAWQRRAAARAKLGSLRAAAADLKQVLALEPGNKASAAQLDELTRRMGTKGSKSKSSPISTPVLESKPIVPQPKIVELPDNHVGLNTHGVADNPQGLNKPREVEFEDAWTSGKGENVTVLKTVKKPPHLRSKRPLKPVEIQEIQLGKTALEKPATRLQIIEIEDVLSHGDTNNNDSNKKENQKLENKPTGEGDKVDVEKMTTDELKNEKFVGDLVAPASSVQFMATWKTLKDSSGGRSDYLSIIDPSRIPSIFEDSLESDVLGEILNALAEKPEKFTQKKVSSYLIELTKVKRFWALAFFLTKSDKQCLTKLLNHCQTEENCSEDELTDLRNKYEL